MAQPRKNIAKILPAAAASLFTVGAGYYGFLLFDSFWKMRYTIHPSGDGMSLVVSDGIAPRAIPYLIALALLILFAAVQWIALWRPNFTVIASLSAAVPLAFSLFTDVTLSEFTRVGLLQPASLIKYAPFILACLLWAIAEIARGRKE